MSSEVTNASSAQGSGRCLGSIGKVILWAPLVLLIASYVVSAAIAARGFRNPSLERTSFWLYILGLLGWPIYSVVVTRWNAGRLIWWLYVVFMCAVTGGWVCEWASHKAASAHQRLAQQYEQQRDHAGALAEYRWLTEKWWYRVFGQRDAFSPLLMSVAGMAREVGDFELARRSYERIISGEQDAFHRTVARQNLQDLEYGLKVADAYEQWLAGARDALEGIVSRTEEDRKHAQTSRRIMEQIAELGKVYPGLLAELRLTQLDELDVLYDVALVFEFDLGSQAKAKEVYEKILGMDVPDISKQLARRRLDEWAKATPQAGPG